MATIAVSGLAEAMGFIEKLKGGLVDFTSVFARVAEFVKDTTKQRVLRKGEGPDGPWTPPWNRYSPSWAKLREEQGHKIDHVYLMYTGGMWAAQTQESSANTLRVFFMPTASNPIRVKATKGRKAYTLYSKVTNAQKAYHLDKKRPFHALNDKDMDFIAKKFAEHVRQLIQGS